MRSNENIWNEFNKPLNIPRWNIEEVEFSRPDIPDDIIPPIPLQPVGKIKKSCRIHIIAFVPENMEAFCVPIHFEYQDDRYNTAVYEIQISNNAAFFDNGRWLVSRSVTVEGKQTLISLELLSINLIYSSKFYWRVRRIQPTRSLWSKVIEVEFETVEPESCHITECGNAQECDVCESVTQEACQYCEEGRCTHEEDPCFHCEYCEDDVCSQDEWCCQICQTNYEDLCCEISCQGGCVNLSEDMGCENFDMPCRTTCQECESCQKVGLTLDSLSDFPSYEEEYGKVLRVNERGELKWKGLTFLDLFDTPDTYENARSGYPVVVNDSKDGLKFIEPTFLWLKDTPNEYTGHADEVVIVSPYENGLWFTPFTFINLNDTPPSYSGAAKKYLRVKEEEDGIEFVDIGPVRRFLDLEDTPDSYTNAAKKFLRVKETEDGIEFVPLELSFLNLTDTPDYYTGQGGKYLMVRETEDGLEFVGRGPIRHFIDLEDTPDEYPSGRGDWYLKVRPDGLLDWTREFVDVEYVNTRDASIEFLSVWYIYFHGWAYGYWQFNCIYVHGEEGSFPIQVRQDTQYDPIADDWTTYGSFKEKKDIIDENTSLLDKFKETKVYRFKMKPPDINEIKKDLQERKKDKTDEEINQEAQEIYQSYLTNPKYTTERIGIVIDENTPKELLIFDENNKPKGFSLRHYVGYLHGVIKELVDKVEALENEIKKLKRR